nr:hypothetical protein [Burkholderia territorii]
MIAQCNAVRTIHRGPVAQRNATVCRRGLPADCNRSAGTITRYRRTFAKRHLPETARRVGIGANGDVGLTCVFARGACNRTIADRD